ncbi:hypothetical protein HK099_000212 [Clydaea vesicula]|uniref:Uncharacterized protein n=1 Tax=Clydaea vesicula TaxID=447962 RepID=A0AAD5TVN9_9FUNG|nr:hypothetical protein HK099_000212 [Clydaea vesicula]
MHFTSPEFNHQTTKEIYALGLRFFTLLYADAYKCTAFLVESRNLLIDSINFYQKRIKVSNKTLPKDFDISTLKNCYFGIFENGLNCPACALYWDKNDVNKNLHSYREHFTKKDHGELLITKLQDPENFTERRLLNLLCSCAHSFFVFFTNHTGKGKAKIAPYGFMEKAVPFVAFSESKFFKSVQLNGKIEENELLEINKDCDFLEGKVDNNTLDERGGGQEKILNKADMLMDALLKLRSNCIPVPPLETILPRLLSNWKVIQKQKGPAKEFFQNAQNFKNIQDLYNTVDNYFVDEDLNGELTNKGIIKDYGSQWNLALP